MTNPQLNRLRMNKAVANLNRDHEAVWKTLAVFGTAQSELELSIAGRNTALSQQSKTTKGLTDEKETGIDRAIKAVTDLAKNTAAYALNMHNQDLYAQVSYTKSYLLELDNSTQVATLRQILTVIEAEEDALADYNVTKDRLKEAHWSIDQIDRSQTKARELVTEKSTATLSVPQWEARGRQALAIMDRLVHNFESVAPDYVTQYRQARIIEDLGRRHEDEQNDNGVDGPTKD